MQVWLSLLTHYWPNGPISHSVLPYTLSVVEPKPHGAILVTAIRKIHRFHL